MWKAALEVGLERERARLHVPGAVGQLGLEQVVDAALVSLVGHRQPPTVVQCIQRQAGGVSVAIELLELRPAAVFVTICAISIPLWWIALFQSEPVRRLFVSDERWPVFARLMLPDLLLAFATAAFAWRLWQDRATVSVGLFVLGGWSYATAVAVAWAWRSPTLWFGPALMIAATIGIAVVCHVRFPSRPAR